MSYCSPRKHTSKTCLSLSELQSVAAQYNHENPNSPIPTALFKRPSLLTKALSDKFKNCPKNADYCWLQNLESQTLYNKLKSNYRPLEPSSWEQNKREWLTNYDILYVMKQYEQLYSSFMFLGVFPIDFAENDVCHLNNICNFSAKQIIEGKKKYFGMVLNLDKHNEPGSHWVSLFCCLDPSSVQYGVCYFDSGASKPPALVRKFLKTIYDELGSPKEFVKKYNTKRKQFQGTECGVFSILFLEKCLENPRIKYRKIREKIKSDRNDNIIHSYRKVFWQPRIKKKFI